MTTPSSPSRPAPARGSGRGSAAAGVVATVLGLSTSTLVAALLPGGHLPAAGARRPGGPHTPAGLREAVIGAVGTSDKPLVLACVVLLVALGLGSVAGGSCTAGPRAWR